MIEALVIIGIVGVVTFGMAEMTVKMQRSQLQMDSRILVDVFRRNLVSLINNTNSWNSTVNAKTSSGVYLNPQLHKCAQATGYCSSDGTASGAPVVPPSAGFLLVLYDASGTTAFYDATVATNGVSPMGVTCGISNYDQVGFVTPGSGNSLRDGRGNDNCPFRFVLTWTYTCGITLAAGQPCPSVNVQVSVSAPLLFNPGPNNKSLTINTANYAMPTIYP